MLSEATGEKQPKAGQPSGIVKCLDPDCSSSVKLQRLLGIGRKKNSRCWPTWRRSFRRELAPASSRVVGELPLSPPVQKLPTATLLLLQLLQLESKQLQVHTQSI